MRELCRLDSRDQALLKVLHVRHLGGWWRKSPFVRRMSRDEDGLQERVRLANSAIGR